MMNGRERVLKVLAGEIPDRIPHFEWSIAHNVIQQANIWPKFAWSYEQFIDYYDIDAVVAWPLYAVRRKDPSESIDELGIVRRDSHEDYGISSDAYAPLKTFEQVRRFNFPDPDDPLCWRQLIGLVKRFKGEKAIVMKLRDVFSWPRELRGYEQFMIDIALNKEAVLELVSKSAEYCMRQARVAVQLGAEVIVTADDIATNQGLLFSPRSFRELFLPKYREIVACIKKLGAYVIKHTDGNITEILDDLVETGVDCLDPIDPLSGMSLHGLKERYGRRICLKGNVNCVGVLDGGERERVVEETLKCIRVGGPGGRYILSSSNSIHSGIPLGNYAAMIETLREHGSYPLD